MAAIQVRACARPSPAAMPTQELPTTHRTCVSTRSRRRGHVLGMVAQSRVAAVAFLAFLVSNSRIEGGQARPCSTEIDWPLQIEEAAIAAASSFCYVEW